MTSVELLTKYYDKHQKLLQSQWNTSTLRTNLQQTQSTLVCSPSYDLFLEPFLLSLQSSNSVVLTSALQILTDLYIRNLISSSCSVPSSFASSFPSADTILDLMTTLVIELSNTPHDQDVELQMLRYLVAVSTHTRYPVHNLTLLKAIKAVYKLHLEANEDLVRAIAKTSIQQIVQHVFTRLENPNESVSQMYPQVYQALGFSSIASNQAAKDAYLVFRALCKISSRVLSDTFDDHYTTAYANKVLALSLLQMILKQPGPVFLANAKLVHAIQTYLYAALVQNCTSSVPFEVASSLELLQYVFTHFKRHLKEQLRVFLTTICVALLQSLHTIELHKIAVLQAVEALVQANPAFFVEVFVNYDCNASIDIYHQLIRTISKLASSSPGDQVTTQAFHLLVVIGHSLREIACQAPEEAPAHAPKSTALTEILATFDRETQQQKEVAQGILLFNMKPKDGLRYLAAKAYVTLDLPESIAQFFKAYQTHSLDKTVVGEYLGREPTYQDGFCVRVLQAYLDLFEFQDLSIDQAIREFLRGFRLPGEAQKIDRIMENFARRYCACNPQIFPNGSDTAFILAFSIIMLQTDLHNPSILPEKKMTKAGFVRNNRGIDDGQDLPLELLESIYDRILAHPFQLQDPVPEPAPTPPSSASFFPFSATTSETQRKQAFELERQSMLHLSQQQLQTPLVRARSFVTIQVQDATTTQVIKPMTESLWSSLLACCTIRWSLESAEECCDGYLLGLELTGALGLENEQVAFLLTLLQHTGISTIATHALEPVHLHAIKTLLHLPVSILRTGWRHLFSFLSELTRLQYLAEGLQSDMEILTNAQVHATPSAVEKANAHAIAAEMDWNALEQVYLGTAELSDAEIVAVVQALAHVVEAELFPPAGTPIRIGTLQKLVEVADVNLPIRSRRVWTHLWEETLASLLVRFGLHPQERISLFTIDSLRQLTMNFLNSKPELSSFHFQQVFCKPLLAIFDHAQANSHHQLVVLECWENLVLNCSAQLVSGWHSVHELVLMALTKPEAQVQGRGYRLLQLVLTNPMLQGWKDHAMSAFLACFTQAVLHLPTHIAELITCLQYVLQNVQSHEQHMYAYVFELMTAVLASPRELHVQVEQLVDVGFTLKKYISPSDTWIAYLIEHLTPCLQLMATKSISCERYRRVFHDLVLRVHQLVLEREPEKSLLLVFNLDVQLIQAQAPSSPTDAVVEALKHVIDVAGPNFRSPQWQMVLETLDQIAQVLQPQQDFPQDATRARAYSATLVDASECLVQLQRVLGDIIFANSPYLTKAQWNLVMQLLSESATTIAASKEHLQGHPEAASMLPEIHQQQVVGKLEYVRAFLYLYKLQKAPEDQQVYHERFKTVLTEVFDEFRLLTNEQQDRAAYIPMLSLILQECRVLSQTQIKAHAPWLYPLIVELVLSPQPALAKELHAALLHFGKTMLPPAPFECPPLDCQKSS